MEKWVIEENIDRFREMLARNGLTEEQRATIGRLLAEEQAKIAGAGALPAGNPPIKAT